MNCLGIANLPVVPPKPSTMTHSTPTPSVPAGSLVLITGLNGHIAAHTARNLLARGYRVRGTVRNIARAKWLTEKLFKAEASNGTLEVVQVPDLTAPGAFDSAIKGVAIVIATATPVPDPSNPDPCIDDAVAATKVLLEAALAEEGVREVVATTSFLAATMMAIGMSGVVDRDTYNEVAIQAMQAGASGGERAFMAYCVSKVRADQEAWKFMRKRNPQFNLNMISPGLVMGEPLDADHVGRPSGLHPTGIVSSFITEGNADARTPIQVHWIDVRDIAMLHVGAALDPDVKNERIQEWGTYHNWNTVLAMLRKLYPEQKQVPGNVPGQQDEATLTTDQSTALQLLKRWTGQDDFLPLEGMLKDTIDPVIARL